MGVWMYTEEMEDPTLSSMPGEVWVMGPGVLNSKVDALYTLPLSCEEVHVLELSICYKWDLMVIMYGWYLSIGMGQEESGGAVPGITWAGRRFLHWVWLCWPVMVALELGKGFEGGCGGLGCGAVISFPVVHLTRQVALGFCLNVRGSEDLPVMEP